MDVRIVVVAILVAPALAGCTQAPQGDDGDTPPEDPRVMTLPAWELGEWWEYEIEVPGFETETVRMTYAWDKDDFSETRGWKHYMLGGPRDHAVFHAIFDVNPFLGRIHSEPLSPHEDGGHSSMFAFPLEPPSKSWDEAPTQVFFGKHRTFEATYSTSVPSPGGPTEGYKIVAQADDGSEVRYNYVPEVKWFTSLQARDANGELFVQLTLQDHGFEATDKGYFVRPRVLGTIDRNFSTGLEQTQTFNVYGNGDYGDFEYLAVGIRLTPQGDVGRVDLEIQDPDGVTRWNDTVTSDQGPVNRAVEIHPSGSSLKTGDWTVQVDALNDANLWLEANGAWEFCGKDGKKLDCP